MAIPLAPLIGVAVPLIEPIRRAMEGDYMGALGEARNRFTGFDENGKFNPEWLLIGWGPVVGGLLVHKIVGGYLGLNRILAAHKIPIRV